MKKLNKEKISKSHNSPLTSHHSFHHSGITLIALVVTVVVLLILAGVTITLMFGENNIFDLAKDAAGTTNIAIEDEKTKVEGLDQYIKDNVGSTGNSGGGSGGEETPKDPTEKWDLTKVTVVPGTENLENPVPLPNGFVKSGIDGEQNVNTGLVIYQIPEDEREGIDWAQKTDETYLDVQKKYNQFVWVPVDDPSEMFGTAINEAETDPAKKEYSLGKLYNFTTTGTAPKNWNETTNIDGKKIMSWTSDTSFREPDVLTGSGYDNTASNYTYAKIKDKNGNLITTDTQFKTQLQEEFEAMRTSVETYGGFYIGRYETGNWHESQNIYGNTNAVVVRGNNDISATKASDSKADWYACYQKSKEVVNAVNIKSSMIWGCQWDRTLEWIVDTNRTLEGNKDYTIVTNSRSWGNYRDRYEGKKATGSSDSYQKNQIYDMAGNVHEFTLEAYGGRNRQIRRGIQWSLWRR